MAREIAALQYIDHFEQINHETHYEFIYHLQKAMLLALREQGRLPVMAYRHAEAALLQQRRNRARNIQEKGRRND